MRAFVQGATTKTRDISQELLLLFTGSLSLSWASIKQDGVGPDLVYQMNQLLNSRAVSRTSPGLLTMHNDVFNTATETTAASMEVHLLSTGSSPSSTFTTSPVLSVTFLSATQSTQSPPLSPLILPHTSVPNVPLYGGLPDLHLFDTPSILLHHQCNLLWPL